MTVSNTVTTATLGKGGPVVNRLGFGAMGMSQSYGAFDDEESIAVLNRAIDLGCNFFDTSDVYGFGANEKLLSKVLKTRRNEIFLCSKFAFQRTDTGITINGTPEYVKKACAASLERLGIDSIDLYYQHRVDPNTPIEDTMKALKDLVEEGKIKHIGLSECSAETLRKAYVIHPVAAVQVEFSPWTLDIETNGLLDACRELGVSIVAYSPLGRGFLTGRFKSIDDFEEGDNRRNHPRFQGENFQKNLEIVQKIEELAEKKKTTPSALCLAWVLAQGEDFITIPGTKRVKYLEENLKALDVTITNEDDKAIRDIVASLGGASGNRYPEAMMAALNK
ncbi:hypothetical protein SmJEL517_g04727 [Synchytrium microbalum]|uniref:NADP-dependent oxidoreductase domain-containing protein n=1 Tax=Synchytrium microbalum TaxID=1806994 RepID=A0A507C216_9FUNG|nr:uncharacterized protein SmJEL517_g04727 [Synchytrium microbalum]TPX32134.1 hypothetical protein SmJEL517_g04727 [Synchytrium microbalum]